MAILAFKTKFQTHPPKLAEVEPRFRKVSLPPAKLCMLFWRGWRKEGVGGRGRKTYGTYLYM